MDSINLGIRISADGKGAESTINSLNKTIEKVGDSSKKASQSLGGIEKAAQGLGSAATTAGRALATLGAAFSARELIQTADAYSGILAKLKLVSGSTAEFAAAQSKLFEISQRNMTPLAETVQLYSRLATSMRDLGRSQADTLAITDLVGKSIRISGADASSAAAGILQFAQAIGSGVLRGDEFNSMMENSPRLAKALADGLNVPIGALREMAAQGELTADKVVNAILSQSDVIKREYTQMPVTISGAFQQIQNALTQYVGQTDQASGASKELANALSMIAVNLNTILDPMAKLIALVTKVEVGGWLTLRDIIKEITSTTGGFDPDPELQKLLRYGRGQVPIPEIAGPPPQAAPTQKEFFDGVKRGANDAALAMTKLSDQQKAVAQIVIDTAKAYKVDPAFALAIAQQESGFNQLAKSAAGARGVMQLMPGTAKQLGVNFSDLNDNIKGGVLYLSEQEKQFKSLRLAAAAYNAGPGNVQKYGGVPPFKETQNYVTSVGALYQKWQQVLGAQGEAFVSAKDQADELSTAFKQVQTHQDDNIKKADEYARVQVEKIKTQLAAMDQEREAAARLTAEQLAGAKTYEDKARIIEAAQAKAAEYNAQALEMVRAEYDAQQQSLEAKKQAYQAELAQADKYNVSIDDQFKLKQAIRAADNDLLLLAENRAQAEITAAGKVNEFAKQSADLKRNEVTAIDGIIAAYQRQADILDRLTAAKQAGANADQLALLNDVYQSTGNLPELVSPDQIERMQQYILSTQALKGAVDELTGSQKKNQEQAVKEQQLRENAFWDQLIGRAQDYANIWSQIGENSNDAFGTMMVASNKFIKNIDQIAEAYKEMRGDKKGSFALDMAEDLAQAQNALNMVTQSLILVRNQYEKGSDEYKKYDQAAAGVAAAAKVAAIAEGVLAVVHQMSSGDPYSAIPRALAVAAMIASMGISTGASGSGGISAAAQKRRDEVGTGTVFGDTAAQSESIANSLEIIKSNSSNDLNYSAAMLRALEDLSNSILALANQVTMTVMPSIDAAIQASGMQFGKQNISLFSGFNTQLTDSGIGWFEASLSRILKGDFTAKMYADITKSFEVMGSELSESTDTYVRDASQEVSRQVTMIFKDMVKALQDGADAFGISSEEILTGLKGFKVGMEQISLKDMTMEEQTAALNAVFSKNLDLMASRINKVYDLGLNPFRKAGEGMAETYFRVSESVNRATGELSQMGLTIIDYTKLQLKDKQAKELSGQLVKDSYLAVTKVNDASKAWIKTLDGGAADIRESLQKLESAFLAMRTAGINTTEFDIGAATGRVGGMDAFLSLLQDYNDNYLSQAENVSGAARDLSEQFGKLGYAMPTSTEGFRQLVEGLKASGKEGSALFAAVLQLQGGFKDLANEIAGIKDKYASILDPFKAISDQIKAVGTDFGKLIGGLTGDSQGRISTIESEAARNRKNLNQALQDNMADSAARSQEIVRYEAMVSKWRERLRKELAKKPKNQDKALINNLQAKIDDTQTVIRSLDLLNMGAVDAIKQINNDIATVNAQEGIDKASELARLSLEKQAIIDDARLAMGSTLEDIFTSIVQTIQQAQQRLQSVLDLQKSIASQIAQLQGPQAVFGLASTDRNNAFGAIDTYINTLSDGRARDVGVEVGLLNTAQQAVMAKYNAEVAAIQEAQQAYIAAETEKLNAALQLQIDAINAATEAAIEAENDRLNAAIKSKQKEFDAANKLTQKQFDLEQKALQKAHDAQLKALGDELDAANKLRDAIKGIQDYVRGMALGGNSPLSPEQRLAEAQRQYQDLLARAQGGDADAMQKLSGASDAYLEASKQYYGSGTQYANTFDAVKNAMSAIGGMSAPDPDSIQSRIDALREAQAEQMDLLRESQAERLDGIREAQQDNLEAMREASQKTTDAIREAAQKQIEEAQKATQQAIADLSDPNKNEAMKAAREAAERDLAELARLAELTRKEAETQAEDAKRQAADQAERAWILANNQLKLLDASAHLNADQLAALNAILANSGIKTIPATEIPAIEIPAFAKGGYAQAGLALVGEQGPEIVRFSRPAQVMTADETRDALRGGNDGKIVQAIAELKAEMRAVVVTQSNANPQIIAELSEMKNRLAKMERTQRFTVGS